MKAKVDVQLIQALKERQISRQELEHRLAELRKRLRRNALIYAIVVTLGVIAFFLFGLLTGANVSDNQTLSLIFFVLTMVTLVGVIVFHLVYKGRNKKAKVEYETCYHYYFGLYLLDSEVTELFYNEYGVDDRSLKLCYCAEDYLDLHVVDDVYFMNFMAGKYGDVPFASHEMKVQQEVDGHLKETFDGQRISFDNVKKESAAVAVIQKGFRIAKTDSLISKFKKPKQEEQPASHDVELGNKEFCKVFRCRLVEDNAQIHELIDSTSNVLLAFAKKIKGKVLISFTGNDVSIMIDGMVNMDPTISESAFERNVREFKALYRATFDFIDALRQIYG